ncbi:MAG: bifunctional adenosylcobinamide kinase/adenosylcobinamide-phosphate guanylyltransferase [Clostridium sp.]|nr:bifunctional adenosylcobinamide kinase/adenosylcobinamide-phosphate guanylyltransferase [Clostridium sp.]
MIEFIIGGMAQGKLKYVLDKNNLTKQDVCNGEECDYNNINKKVLYNFHLLCRRLLKDNINIHSFLEELFKKNNDIIIISNEIGYGIVPLDKEERIWREETGRACTTIAKKAAIVTRVMAGIPVNIKNEISLDDKSEEKSFNSTLNVALIRHGLTEGNKNKKYIGTVDEGLSLNGIYTLFDSISKEIYPRVHKVYSSPMKRCMESAKMIYPKAKIILKDDLREINFGDFENKNYDELKDNIDYQRWLASRGTFHIPNGESREEFNIRCQKCFEEIINESLTEEGVALIVHGGTIMSILDKYSNPHQDFYNWQVKNGQGYVIEIDKSTWINNKKVRVIGEIK